MFNKKDEWYFLDKWLEGQNEINKVVARSIESQSKFNEMILDSLTAIRESLRELKEVESAPTITTLEKSKEGNITTQFVYEGKKRSKKEK